MCCVNNTVRFYLFQKEDQIEIKMVTRQKQPRLGIVANIGWIRLKKPEVQLTSYEIFFSNEHA
jgi:hypothetical protein